MQQVMYLTRYNSKILYLSCEDCVYGDNYLHDNLLADTKKYEYILYLIC